MIRVRCIEKFKDKNGKIIGYRLIDQNKLIRDFKADDVKNYIKTGVLEVVNLTLTSDNRLVEHKSINEDNKQDKILYMLNKAVALGVPIKDIKTACGHVCKLIEISAGQHILLIPDDVVKLDRCSSYTDLDNEFSENLHGIRNIKVIDGKNLESTSMMFNKCNTHV